VRPNTFRAVLAMRPSPDWRSLAQDYRAGLAIERARFLPDGLALGFPDDLGELIDLWNRSFALDFFTCRLTMTQIAARQLDRVAGARRLGVATLAAADVDLARDLVFFHDDDDWFAPELAEAVAALAATDFDVVVFPLVRLWKETHTFVRPAPTPPAIAGRAGGFGFRYQSNNYGVAARRLDDDARKGMREHMRASTYAQERGFRDLYINRTLGVTAKTPCSASMLAQLKLSADPRAGVLQYVEAIRTLALPDALSWLRPGVAEIADLFARAAAQG
jgi:hypothetical protein